MPFPFNCLLPQFPQNLLSTQNVDLFQSLEKRGGGNFSPHKFPITCEDAKNMLVERQHPDVNFACEMSTSEQKQTQVGGTQQQQHTQ